MPCFEKYQEETIVKKIKTNPNKKKYIQDGGLLHANIPLICKARNELIVSIEAVVGGCKLALKSQTSVPTAISIDSKQTYCIILFLEGTPELF